MTPPANGARNIVIVGGGFAGATLVQSLARRLPSGYRLVLISEESYTTFNPMLAEVVSASVFPEHVVAPLRQILDGDPRNQFIMGQVRAIDFRKRQLFADTLAGGLQLKYEHLVLAFGRRANMQLIPGMAEHALPLKLVGDAMFIRNRVLQRVARIELESDAQVRQRLGHFIVIGGGFSGVEVAGGLSDLLRDLPRYYPRVAAHELKVSLLQDAERLLKELPRSLGDAAAASLRKRGVGLKLHAQVTQVTEQGALLADGSWVEGSTVICTIGTRANPLIDTMALPSPGGRIPTRNDLSVASCSGVWAMGDCAQVRNGTAGDMAPATAQFAVAQARLLAHNLLARIEGRSTRDFAHRSRGMMATTGHLKGVALLFGVPLTGLPAWLLWRGYYLLRMPTWGRRLRIWVEWTWGMFFPADITHLRFTRSLDADNVSAFATPANKAAQADSFDPVIGH